MKRQTIASAKRGLLILIIGFVLTPIMCFAGQDGRIATVARADSGTVPARARTITTHLSAYARVEPITLVRLKALQAGIVTGFAILPGQTVKAGAVLGHLSGPAVASLLAARRAAVADVSAALSAAKKILVIERQKQAVRLTTQKIVYQAKAALARARARLDNAKSQLAAARASLVLKSPADGIVLAVNAAEGEQVRADQTILSVQPVGGLWLMARYYGADAAAIRVGMTGKFQPANGGPAIPVRVRTVIGPVGKDGGQRVGLFATVPVPLWVNGEAGSVTILGAKRTYVAVPSRALILDRGQWWVLVHTPQGDKPRKVVPGPSRGEWTFIEEGLKPGTEVVVENAYLKYHKNISQHYLPPY